MSVRVKNITKILNVNKSDLNNIVNIIYYDKGFLYDSNAFKQSGVFEAVLSVFFTVSLALSLIGNLCTCAVVIRDRTMRTRTNYYLFNLAIADLTTAMFIPIEIIVLWIPDLFGKVTGHIVFLFWDLMCNCSVLTILALTIERYIVISKPFLLHTFVLKSRVFKILAANWTIAASFCILNVFYIYNIEEHKNVYIFFNKEPNGLIVLLIGAEVTIFFIFPMVVIIMLYALITLKLKTKQLKNNFAKQNRSKAIKMLAAVAASFFICWAPYNILRIMAIVPTLRQKYYTNYWMIFGYLNIVNSYASTAINPILYSLMSRKFRRAFKEFLKGRNTDSQRTSPGVRVNTSAKNSNVPETNLKLKSFNAGNVSFD